MKLPPLYPILDVELLERRRCAVPDAADAMIRGGAQILQWRCKRPVMRPDFEAAERVAGYCQRFCVQFVVNDRADIALLLDAGLHLGQDDLPPAAARRLLGPERPIGFSTHNARQLSDSEVEPVDYVALGPMFATTSKDKPDPVLGIGRLEQWRPLTARPLVAIGGITRQTAPDVIAAGADSVAVIGDLIPVDATPESIRRRMEEWLSLLHQ
jgi:thiamine-phosphate pyrophosphorylase